MKLRVLLIPAFAAMSSFLLMGVALADNAPTASESTPLKKVRLQEAYGKLPLSFEANLGQTDARVKFLSRGQGYALFLTPTETVLTLRSAASPSRAASLTSLAKQLQPATDAIDSIDAKDAGIKETQRPDRRDDATDAPRQKTQSTVMRMHLVGANLSAALKGLEELPGKVNAFIGKDTSEWRTNIPTYSKVKYHEVYPGIDVIYYGNQGQLEFDFIVAPGVDPNAIRLKFEGPDRLEVDADGDLLLHFDSGEILPPKPFVYQTANGARHRVSGGYVLTESHQISFQVAAYDRSRPLVIDPTLFYSTYLGGSSEDQSFGIAVDAAGNAYVTGFTASSNFPTTTGAFQTTFAGVDDVFVTKLNPTGSALVYSTYLGGGNSDIARDIVIDGLGNAYVTGFTKSSNFPTTPGAFKTALGPAQNNAFVTKLSPSGSGLVYSTYLGGTAGDGAFAIVVDGIGNAFVTGMSGSFDFPTTLGSFEPVMLGSGGSAFVTKLNPTGSGLVYSTFLSAVGHVSTGLGIAVDALGNAYVTGIAAAGTYPTTVGAFQMTYNGGGSDTFVTKLNPTGSTLVYSTYLGGSASDNVHDLTIDSLGNAYVTGTTNSTNFPTTSGAFQPTYNGGGADAFVTKLNSTGSGLVYSTFIGGNDGDDGVSITLDTASNTYVTGSTGSPNFPTTSGAIQTTFAGGSDVFVSVLNTAGSGLIFSTYLGGNSNDAGRGIAVDQFANAYVTGTTDSTNFPVTSGAFQTTFGGGASDGFAAKITQIGEGVPLAEVLMIDEESIDNSTPSIQRISFNPPFCGGPAGGPADPSVCVNDDIANPGVRTLLFTRPRDVTPLTDLVLPTGQVGDAGLFRFSNPDPQMSQQNGATFTTQEFVTASGAAADENNLDKIAGVVPLGEAEITALQGRTVCAVVYDHDISVTSVNPPSASLKGPTMGLTAFTVTAVTPHPAGGSFLPQITVNVLPSAQVEAVCRTRP